MAIRYYSSWVLALCIVLLGACTREVVDDGDDPGDESDTEGFDDVCELQDPYICECLFAEVWYNHGLVYGTYAVAEAMCFTTCDQKYPDIEGLMLTPVACSEADPGSFDCSTWRPSLAVSYEGDSNIYHVDRDLISELTIDPGPLHSCDGATVSRVTSGGYLVSDADPGELLYELGLRDRDVIRSINDYPLDSTMDAALAFTQLWSNGETTFSLELRRDGAPHRLSYSLSQP